MSAHFEEQQSSSVSYAIPVSILIAIAIESAFLVARFAMPASWFTSERYWLLSTGIYAASGLLFTMGIADLARRLPERQAAGARVAMVGYAVYLGLVLSGGVINTIVSTVGERGMMIWKLQSYGYLLLYIVVAVGLAIAAGGFARVAAPAIGLIVVSIALAPPSFVSQQFYDVLGKSAKYVLPVIGVAQLVLQAFLAREAARSSVYGLPAQPTQPFALLGSALRGRVIAMFVLIAFTLFAMGGRSLGAMKVAMVGAPLINLAAFVVFAVAALRAGRGLDQKMQVAFAVAGGAAAWCAGVLAVQTPALYQMLGGDGGSFMSERNSELAQALPLVMPLVATISVVVALVSAGAHVFRMGHVAVSDSFNARTTTFVVLMATSVLVQTYAVPKVRSMNELILLGLVAAIAGIAALLVAANLFRRASEATGTTALPTATVLPP